MAAPSLLESALFTDPQCDLREQLLCLKPWSLGAVGSVLKSFICLLVGLGPLLGLRLCSQSSLLPPPSQAESLPSCLLKLLSANRANTLLGFVHPDSFAQNMLPLPLELLPVLFVLINWLRWF